VPARRSSSYAAAGTVAHTLIERAISDPKILDRMRGCTVTQEGHAVLIDDDFIEGIELMLNYVVAKATDQAAMAVEYRVYLDPYFTDRPKPPVRLFGRVDVAVLDHATFNLEIIDYKNGAGVLVDPTDNPQMLYYAAGVVAEPERKTLCKTITLTVVQPHAQGVEKIRSATIDYLDLMMWIDEVLIPGVYACAADDAPLVTGSWCRFCPASHACPALQAKATEMAKRDFADHVLPQDPAALAEALNTAQLAETWIDAVRGYAIEQLKSQVHIPGWSLGPTRPTRRWTDEALIEAMLMDHGLTPTVTHRHELKSPAQLEKLLRRQSPSIWGQVNALIEMHSSGVKLVRADNDPAKDFDDAEF
jgi:hypothetical protein